MWQEQAVIEVMGLNAGAGLTPPPVGGWAEAGGGGPRMRSRVGA